MRYFLDTEFNGLGGELISLALVPEHGDQEFYALLALPEEVHPWVDRHVVPYLNAVPPSAQHDTMTRLEAANALVDYFAHDDEPVIVADWPDDIAYFCSLLITGPGDMVPIGSLKFEFVSSPGFSTAAISKVPHNALHDARALRDFVVEWEG
jgi:hypothetical protein